MALVKEYKVLPKILLEKNKNEILITNKKKKLSYYEFLDKRIYNSYLFILEKSKKLPYGTYSFRCDINEIYLDWYKNNKGEIIDDHIFLNENFGNLGFCIQEWQPIFENNIKFENYVIKENNEIKYVTEKNKINENIDLYYIYFSNFLDYLDTINILDFVVFESNSELSKIITFSEILKNWYINLDENHKNIDFNLDIDICPNWELFNKDFYSFITNINESWQFIFYNIIKYSENYNLPNYYFFTESTNKKWKAILEKIDFISGVESSYINKDLVISSLKEETDVIKSNENIVINWFNNSIETLEIKYLLIDPLLLKKDFLRKIEDIKYDKIIVLQREENKEFYYNLINKILLLDKDSIIIKKFELLNEYQKSKIYLDKQYKNLEKIYKNIEFVFYDFHISNSELKDILINNNFSKFEEIIFPELKNFWEIIKKCKF